MIGWGIGFGNFRKKMLSWKRKETMYWARSNRSCHGGCVESCYIVYRYHKVLFACCTRWDSIANFLSNWPVFPQLFQVKPHTPKGFSTSGDRVGSHMRPTGLICAACEHSCPLTVVDICRRICRPVQPRSKNVFAWFGKSPGDELLHFLHAAWATGVSSIHITLHIFATGVMCWQCFT